MPDWLVRKMLLNNAVSAAVGFVPLVGDIVLAVFKANSRNAALLEEFLRIRGEEFLKRDGDRDEDPRTVRPGAGTEVGERVPGKEQPVKQNSGGWFRRKSKSATPPRADNGAPVRRESRFVEDMPGPSAVSDKKK